MPCDLDATRIAEHLYQGSKPREGSHVARSGFDVLILTAKEYQPPSARFPGVRVVHAPLDDSGLPMTAEEWQVAKGAANRVAMAVRARQTVLVTCHQGRNRSGLVSALALYLLANRRISGTQAGNRVRQRRKGALENPWFNDKLRALPRVP